MRRPLIVAALRLLSLALVDRGAAVARVGAPVCVKEIVDTTRNDAGQGDLIAARPFAACRINLYARAGRQDCQSTSIRSSATHT